MLAANLHMTVLVAATTVGIMIIASSFLETVNAQSAGSFQNMTSTLLNMREHNSYRQSKH